MNTTPLPDPTPSQTAADREAESTGRVGRPTPAPGPLPVEGAHAHPGPAADGPPPSGARSRSVLALASACLFFAGVLGVGIVPRLQQSKALKAASRAQDASAVVVSVVTPHAAAAADLLLPGSIEAIEETSVGARTTGYLRRRYVDIGSRVRAGQLLAEIDSPEVDQQLRQAQAETTRSRAGVGQAKADVARVQAVVVQTESETTRLQANQEQARAELARSEAKLAQARAATANARARVALSRQNLEGRKADLAQAQARLAIAEKTFRRWQGLLQEGAVPLQDVDERQSTLEANQASVRAAEAAISSAQADVEASQETVNASQADIAAAEADVSSSRQNVRAAQAAVRSNLANVQAAKASVGASRQNAAAAAAAVGSSQANVRRYAVLRSFERVVAPFDGVITSRNVDTGALISAGGGSSGEGSSADSTPRSGLFGIARTDTLRIRVRVPQTFLTSIRPGQKALIAVREFPHREFTGEVFRIAGALDSTSRTLLTEIRLRNLDNRLVPGMYADIKLAPGGAERSLRIPANTLMTGADGPRVALVTPEGKVHLQAVQLGRDLGTELEITSGLRGDERLISNPTDDLRENTAVQPSAPAR
jgi:RND family efflux transporter MFP subunit